MNNESDNFRAEAAFFRWKPAAWLRVSGADAQVFLQGQFTNELRGLATGGAVYGLWLNQKGRVLADSFVIAAEAGAFWVVSYGSTAAVIRERLEAYIIADDVVVEDQTSSWEAVCWLDAAPPEAPKGVVRWPGRRGGIVEEWIFPSEMTPVIEPLLAERRECSAQEVERRRIAAGVPTVPNDIGPGELPNEGGLETDAISYTKGCYLGQEVMARLKTMGQVRRRLMRVRGNGAVPAVPAELVQAGRKIGDLRSVAPDGEGFVGLALITLLNWQRGEPLVLAGAETRPLKVED